MRPNFKDPGTFVKDKYRQLKLTQRGRRSRFNETPKGRWALPAVGDREASAKPGGGLYTPEQRKRRDESPWTTVQGVLAPLQFLVFLVSLALVVRFLATGDGLAAAAWSVVIKTVVLYLIMVTGAIWEKVVFGQYLFAEPFFWEDVFSMLVLALHTLYLWAWWAQSWTPAGLMGLALAAYATYVINAAQFVVKLRAARLQGQRLSASVGQTAAGVA
jgi:3-vinyl bacteriochlorophyllide hydratase